VPALSLRVDAAGGSEDQATNAVSEMEERLIRELLERGGLWRS
jgi:hypothetical protein